MYKIRMDKIDGLFEKLEQQTRDACRQHDNAEVLYHCLLLLNSYFLTLLVQIFIPQIMLCILRNHP